MEYYFKVTSWEKVTVPEDKEQLLLDAIKNGDIRYSSDVHDLFASDDDVYPDCMLDPGTAMPMTVEDNKGRSTIEVMNGGELIYKNGSDGLENI